MLSVTHNAIREMVSTLVDASEDPSSIAQRLVQAAITANRKPDDVSAAVAVVRPSYSWD